MWLLCDYPQLLLQALLQYSLPLLRLVTKEYRPTLSRDPSLAKDISALEERFFEVKPQSSGLQGLLGNMFSSLMG